MNILLKRIVEQQGSEQFYDLGKDFANFRRMMDGTDEQIKQKFEQAIGAKLAGKRVRARASRGYKQYVKDYEFDVTKVSLDDYYDNYVVVAYDNATPKPKEYFLKPGFKVQILGAATGQPSPQKGGKPEEQVPVPNPVQPKEDPNVAQHQPMAQAPAGRTPSETEVTEENNGKVFDAYPIDNIEKDIKLWLPSLLLKPETPLRDFVRSLGWKSDLRNDKSVAMYDIVIPINALKGKITPDILGNIFRKIGEGNGNFSYNIEKMKSNEADDEWNIRIKKTTKTI